MEEKDRNTVKMPEIVKKGKEKSHSLSNLISCSSSPKKFKSKSKILSNHPTFSNNHKQYSYYFAINNSKRAHEKIYQHFFNQKRAEDLNLIRRLTEIGTNFAIAKSYNLSDLRRQNQFRKQQQKRKLELQNQILAKKIIYQRQNQSIKKLMKKHVNDYTIQRQILSQKYNTKKNRII